MNESTKTLSFVLVAILALGAAWLGRPQPIGVDLPDLVGQPLFADFQDPYDAKSMKIVEYDEDLGELRSFEVAQKNGLWVIPSHQDYPADAEETLAEAANLLVDLNVINVQSQEKQEHVTYGVVRPSLDTLKAGDKGVGKLVTFKDAQGDRLAEIVIGEPVTGQPNQRYVRASDQEPVYIVELNPEKLSTNFQDWVQRDILDLNAFDIKDISIYDYSANPQLSNRGILLNEQDRLKVTARWNADQAQWELDEFEESVGGEMRSSQLLETEELDKDSLDTMKQALDDLQIVDVERKPEGLGAEIVDDSFWQNEEGITSLFERGFYPARDPSGQLKLRSSDGEVKIRTNDGVEYLLRFGQFAGVESGAESAGDDESTEGTVGGLNRFVMVSAAVYQDAFEKPILDLPEADATEEAASAEEADSPDDAAERSDADADEAAVEPNDAEAEVAAAGDTEPEIPPPDDTRSRHSGADTAEADTAAPETDAEADDTVAADSEAESASQDDLSTAETMDQEALDAQREAKLKEYERQMDDYKAKIKTAEEKVDKLNFRFADWYYVVSEDEYRKIHLSRSDIVRGKESTANEGTDIDAFRELEETELDEIRLDQE